MALARGLKHLRALMLWCVWVFLTLTWLTTLAAHWRAGDRAAVLLALVVLALLIVLYFAEGIELAATDLLDKEPERLRDPRARAVLADIQERAAFFYAQRQVFVVVIIAFMSLVTAYSWIVIPFAGRSSSHGVAFWFSLVFTTLTVLWFCQVTPKRLAILNSEMFLAQSSFVWRLIKLVGVLGLPDPTDWLVALAERSSGYGARRHLLPSRAAHYALASQLAGVTLDRVSVSVTAARDGSGHARKRVLVLFLHGGHAYTAGDLHTRTTFASSPMLRLLGLYTAPGSERLDALIPALDAIFTGEAPGKISGFSRDRLPEWAHQTELRIENVTDGGQRAVWTILGQGLPEALWPPEHDRPGKRGSVVALLYEMAADVDTGGLAGDGHDLLWAETFERPCRCYSVRLQLLPSEPAALDAPHLEVAVREPTAELARESARFARLALTAGEPVEVLYPLQGGTYALSWGLCDGGDRAARAGS